VPPKPMHDCCEAEPEAADVAAGCADWSDAGAATFSGAAAMAAALANATSAGPQMVLILMMSFSVQR
jgi:hypothetical protein